MEKQLHSPGPWYAKATAAGQSLIASESTGKTIAVAYDEKDGPVLAAGPEILAALVGMLDRAEMRYPHFEQEPGQQLIAAARAAIAKALGE